MALKRGQSGPFLYEAYFTLALQVLGAVSFVGQAALHSIHGVIFLSEVLQVGLDRESMVAKKDCDPFSNTSNPAGNRTRMLVLSSTTP